MRMHAWVPLLSICNQLLSHQLASAHPGLVFSASLTASNQLYIVDGMHKLHAEALMNCMQLKG